MNWILKPATTDDRLNLLALYKTVAGSPGGIARTPDEISIHWIDSILQKSGSAGSCLLGFTESGQLIAEIHGWKPVPACFNHVISDITMIVHPDFQGKGIGKWIFSGFIEKIKEDLPEITRLELFVRESNTRGRKLYESLGFVQEGRLKRRIRSKSGEPEDDILMATVW